MAKDEDKSEEVKSEEVKNAEEHGGERFDPTTAEQSEKSPEELLADGKCPDCKGEGILSPNATQVCQTCQGTGKA